MVDLDFRPTLVPPSSSFDLVRFRLLKNRRIFLNGWNFLVFPCLTSEIEPENMDVVILVCLFVGLSLQALYTFTTYAYVKSPPTLHSVFHLRTAQQIL